MRRAIAGCALLVMMLAACQSGSTTPTSTGPIDIGYLASITGFCSTWSQEEVQGARLAVETINANGGVLGRPLRLTVRDDQATPDVAVRQARDLILTNGIKLMAGTCSSATGLAVRQTVTDPSKVVYVAPVADGAVFKDAGKNGSLVFGTVPTTQIEGAVLANFVKSHPEWKKVALIGEDYSYSQTVFDAFQKGIQGSNIQVISRDHATVANYTPFITKILAEKPDFLYSNLVVDDLVTFTKQAVPLGLFQQIKMVGFYDLGSLIALGKDAPIGEYGYTYYPEPYIYPAVTKAFADQYQQSTGRVPTGAVADAWNEIQILYQGIKLAGTTDPIAVAKALSGAKIDFAQGSLTIRPCDHLPVVPVAIGTISGPTTADKQFPHLENIQSVDTTALYTPC